MTAHIHEHGGPKVLTDVQRRVAEALVERDVYVYAEKGQGKQIVSAFRRYLESGDAEKITAPLYKFITLKCGYIAHYDLHGFRSVYRDPAKLLGGELYPTVWREGGHGGPVEHSASVYTDGMTDQEVYTAMVALAEEHRDMVERRSAEATRESEIATARELAAKHGLEVT